MEVLVEKRWTWISAIVAAIAVLMMAVVAVSPMTQVVGQTDAAGISSPAKDIAATQHTDIDLGAKVTQIYLISVLAVFLVAVLSFVILMIISKIGKKDE